jgi:phage N-6-adenine-methyltransferase
MPMPKQRPGLSKQDYQTPTEFLEALKKKLKIKEFAIDLAASTKNTVATSYYTEKDNSLVQPWDVEGWGFCNPPYSKITPWVMKAYFEGLLGAWVAMLIPSATGSNWWRDWVHGKAWVMFLNGRLTFVGETAPYPKDHALLLYGPYAMHGYEIFKWREK